MFELREPTHVEHEALLAAIRVNIGDKIDEIRNHRLSGTAPAEDQVALSAIAAVLFVGWRPPAEGPPEAAKANIFSCYPETIPGAGLLATTPPTQPAEVKEEWAVRLGGEGGGIYNCHSRDSAEYQLELFADRSPEVVRRVVTYGRFAPVAPAADVSPDADGVTSPTKKEG